METGAPSPLLDQQALTSSYSSSFWVSWLRAGPSHNREHMAAVWPHSIRHGREVWHLPHTQPTPCSPHMPWQACMDRRRVSGSLHVRADVTYLCCLHLGSQVATIMLIFIMGLAYAPTSPIILPFTLLYFFNSWWGGCARVRMHPCRVSGHTAPDH